MNKWKKYVFLLFMILFAAFQKETAYAFDSKVEIKSCTINMKKDKEVVIKASVKGKNIKQKENYYLFCLEPYESEPSEQALPYDLVENGKNLEFRVPLNLGKFDSRLYSKFVIAVKGTGGDYQMVSKASYITNPEEAAIYDYEFPKAASKKGLQIQPEMMEDARNLGVKNAAMNIILDNFFVSEDQKNEADAIPYTYQGERFWFSRANTMTIDEQVQQMAQTDIVVTAILLLQGQENASILIPDNLDNVGNGYFGLDTSSRESVRTLAALTSFLGQRYMNESQENGRISNWIVGNEVDYYGRDNYMGEYSLADYTNLYARSFRVISTALHSVYDKARVYISLTHCWNQTQPQGGSFTSKDTLDGFISALASEGDIPWNVAYHAYPQPLTDPVFWDDMATEDEDSTYITLRNIQVLTDYVKKHNKDARVILSEQGFTSYSDNYGYDEDLQAAAFAYGYYVTEFNDRIDAFIVTRHVDHTVEEQQGIYNGFWSNTPGYTEMPNQPKKIWFVFRDIDTTFSRDATAFALDKIGIEDWSNVISKFSWETFSEKIDGLSENTR